MPLAIRRLNLIVGCSLTNESPAGKELANHLAWPVFADKRFCHAPFADACVIRRVSVA